MIVSFVIPALNEERFIGRLLDSIDRQESAATIERIEVIVVDNMSQDNTVAIAEQRNCRVVSVTPGRVARARNAGAAVAAGELLAFVDADCELPSDWLKRCTARFVDDGLVAVGTVMAAPHKSASWVEKGWYQLALKPGGEGTELVAWLPTFNLLVRRQAFHDAGGFDEELVTCEDADFGYRLSERGKVLLDQGIATHHHGESKTLGEFFRRECWRGRGSLRTLKMQPSWREFRSVLLPMAFLTLLCAGVILLAIGIIVQSGHAVTILAALLLALGLALPLLISIKKSGIKNLLQGWILMMTYLAARAFGLFWPMSRVER